MRQHTLLFTLLLFAFALTSGAGEKKVLVYIVCGARADALTQINAPAWSMLTGESWVKGYHAAWSLNGSAGADARLGHGAAHIVAATGLAANHHGITDERMFEAYNGPVLPSFMELLAQKDAAFHSAVVVSHLADTVLHPEHGRWHCISCQDPDVNWTERNLYYLCDMLSWRDAPDAFFVLDSDLDKADSSPQKEFQLAMERFGKTLESIRKRPSFPEEDWLIVFAGDGEGKLPMLVCGKRISSGLMKGSPSLLDIAPWCLHHFGADDLLFQLDGKAEIRTE